MMATASLAGAMDSIYNTPVTSGSMSLSNIHMDRSGMGLGGRDMRRLSVGDLLSPMPTSEYSSGYGDQYSNNVEVFKIEPSQPQYDINGQLIEDDVEEITRYDMAHSFSHQELLNPRPFFRINHNSYGESISIPRRLDPLPQMLLENPKNRLYFHHYLNHTVVGWVQS